MSPSQKRNSVNPKIYKAQLQLFPFNFELIYSDQGNLLKLSFNLYLGLKPHLFLESSILREPIENLILELRDFFAGKRAFLNPPHTLTLSTYALQVLLTLREIPRGNSLTYGELAQILKHPQAQRAIGRILSQNPLPLVYPCHRIVGKKGLGGYSQGPLLKWLLLYWERNLSNF